jgi:hypothetical protein
MAVSHQQFVSLQPENLFHDRPPSIGEITRTGWGIRDAHHLLELFGVAAPPIEQPAPGALTATEVEEIDARETLAFLFE